MSIEGEKNKYRTRSLVAEVTNRLHKLNTNEDVGEEIVDEGVVTGDGSGCKVSQDNMPDPVIVNFEDEDGVDEARAMMDACKTLERFEWQPEDLPFYFSQIEAKMGAAGVRKNFTKFQVLSTIIPRKVQDQVKPLLSMQATEFPNKDAYKQLKHEILRIFGPRPEKAVERALGRVLTSQPSELARELVNDLSQCKPKLNCQCCPAIITALWKRHLPPQVRAGIANKVLTKDNFNEVVSLADDIFSSNAPAQAIAAYGVAAVQAPVSSPNLDETQPAIPYPQAEVAAVRGNGRGGRGGRWNRGNRGNRGGNRGGAAPSASSGAPASGGQRHRGTKHPDLPAGEWYGCKMHYKHGKNAFFCSEPATCPWKNVFKAKPQQ